MPLLHAKFYDMEFIERHSNERGQCFLFGDNLEGWGRGGQAKFLRDHPGGVGLATKISPKQVVTPQIWANRNAEFEANWSAAIERAKRALSEGRNVYWPVNGIGTGLAALQKNCPEAWAHFCTYTRSIFDFDASLDQTLSGNAKRSLTLIGCGGRKYGDAHAVDAVMSTIAGHRNLIRVIEGAYSGADRLIGAWTKRQGIAHTPTPADWNGLGRRAGPVRNTAMKDDLITVRQQTGGAVGVIAFPGHDGTASMKEIAIKAGIKVLESDTILAKLFTQMSSAPSDAENRPTP